jgi:hypothetical protein
MRRVLEFCEWKASWWKEQVERREDLSQHLAEGLRAYAEQQADMERHIKVTWSTKWAPARELAQPIIQAAMGAPVMPVAASIEPLVIDLDIDKNGQGAGDSDFEE